MLLKKGSKGEAVKRWQEFLERIGFDIDADGDFGPATHKATREFQFENKLGDDGIVGSKTLAVAEKMGFAGFSNSNEEPKEATGKTILVSAGHTNKVGQDRGAAGNGHIEGELAVELRDAVSAKLREKGFTVTEDGSDGVNDPLTKAIALARKADVAVEIHWNAAGSAKATGVEVLAKLKHRHFAQALAAAVSDAAKLTRRGDKGYRPDNSGAHHRLGFCEAGGLILEVCFISNPDDMKAYVENFKQVVSNLAAVIGAEASN